MEELAYKNLFKDFIEFQKEFKGMTPDATNPFFKSSYITLDGILETVRPVDRVGYVLRGVGSW